MARGSRIRSFMMNIDFSRRLTKDAYWVNALVTFLSFNFPPNPISNFIFIVWPLLCCHSCIMDPKLISNILTDVYEFHCGGQLEMKPLDLDGMSNWINRQLNFICKLAIECSLRTMTILAHARAHCAIETRFFPSLLSSQFILLSLFMRWISSSILQMQ